MRASSDLRADKGIVLAALMQHREAFKFADMNTLLGAFISANEYEQCFAIFRPLSSAQMQTVKRPTKLASF